MINEELANKYKRALDIANSHAELGRYIQLIRETLYKILQSGYVATIDEVIWAECFVNREYFSDTNVGNTVMILREFTKSDWQSYPKSVKFIDSQPLIATKHIDECDATIIVDNQWVQLILKDSEEKSAIISDTFRLCRRYKIAIANDICSVIDRCMNKQMLLDELNLQFNLNFERR